MQTGHLFTTRFGPKGTSSVNTYNRIIKKRYWVFNLKKNHAV